MSRRVTKANEKLLNALASLNIDYENAVRAVLRNLTGQRLRSLRACVNDYYDGIAKYRDELVDEIDRELGYRAILRRADPVLRRGGQYCVSHACDSRKCPEGSHD